MNRIVLTLLVVALSFLLGVAALSLWQSHRQEQRVQEEATILLERVRNVMKLVTVEGDVSEIFHTTSSRNVTLYLPLPSQFSFDKKATVEVRGTVLVGYDLEQLDVSLDPDRRVMTIRNLPEPEILAIDHDLVYRNLDESWFNTFSAEDYSRLNRRAKERLHDAALKSELMARAREQGNSVIAGIAYLAGAAGYELVVEEGTPLPEPAG
ncbi:putative membrane protein [Lewinella marina]|uniref:DUF4230 domain-containing protein n=1 Tax=Neolewinella marina TaxID=438751 RepID=A0A2G0CBB9_9BACT|nr:DUF4230 domain-containing protein [Neolewinella marina]NJB87780.1 putative membrane protein [Neolewinella marina]PHK97250.1 hypothetical protein CGL56_16865 [Neolewinella marina]